MAIAVDWSGAETGERKKIWVGRASAWRLESLESGRSREEVVEHLISAAADEPDLVVGLDFAFSMPGWFVKAQGATDGPAFWEAVAAKGEGWLRRCEPPFFGAAGTKRPSDVELLRRTDREVPRVAGRGPSSTFQLTGASQVGRGSIRGMQLLGRLRSAGFRIWPFDAPAPAFPLVVEIYPRLLTGPAVKSDFHARRTTLAGYADAMPDELREQAACSDDAFDAAISAIEMDRRRDDLLALPPGDEIDRIEGRIWVPRDRL